MLRKLRMAMGALTYKFCIMIEILHLRPLPPSPICVLSHIVHLMNLWYHKNEVEVDEGVEVVEEVVVGEVLDEVVVELLQLLHYLQHLQRLQLSLLLLSCNCEESN